MILLTWRGTAAVQGSPVTAGVDDDGRIVVATYPERAKAANVARRPRASVIVLSEEFNGPWVQVDGDAELITLPDARRAARRLLPLDLRRALRLDEYRQAMVDAGQGVDPHHAHAVGTGRHRGVPGPAGLTAQTVGGPR